MIKSKIQPYIFYSILLAFTICATFAYLNSIFTILLYSIVIVAPIIFDDTKTISTYLWSACFMACFGDGGFLTALNISLFVLEIKKLIIAIRFNRNKKDIVTIFSVWLGLLLILTLYSLLYNHFKIYRMAMFIDFVQCLLACYLVRKSINIKHIVFTLFAAIVVSVGIASYFHIAEIPNKFTRGILDARFGGFFNNVNTLSVYCTLCSSSFIVLMLTKKLPFKYCFCFPFIITSVGLLTKSKAFMLMSILLYISWFVLSFIKSNNKKMFGLYLIFLILGVMAFTFIAKDYISTMIDRFFNGKQDSIFDSITSGRVSIWKAYFKRWLKSPLTFLFGNGYTAQKIATNRYEHSIYLAFLFQFGVLGTIAIISVVVWTLRKNATLQRNPACYIPLIVFLFNGLVSNLSGVLCSCLIWFMAFYFVTMDADNQTTSSSPNTIEHVVDSPADSDQSSQNSNNNS